MRSRWIPSRRNRKKLQKRNGCNKCRKNKECNKKVCVNDNGHAKSFGNVCEAHKYLMKQPKSLKLVSFALGDCKELYSRKYSNTFWLGPFSSFWAHFWLVGPRSGFEHTSSFGPTSGFRSTSCPTCFLCS